MNGRQPIVRLTPITKRTTRVIAAQSKIFPSFFITPPGEFTRASSALEAGEIAFLSPAAEAAAFGRSQTRQYARILGTNRSYCFFFPFSFLPATAALLP